MWKARLLGNTLGQLFRMWRRTLRFEVRGMEWLDRHPSNVLAAWHGRMQGPLFCVAHRGVLTMASSSADGELAARAVAPLGLTAARGSTGKGGSRALAVIEHWIRDGRGRIAGLTVDGPRGPRGTPRRGVVELARSLDLPLIPTSFSARPYWMLRSWDLMLLARPFARTLVQFGPPITITRDTTIEEGLGLLKAALDSMTSALDMELHGRSLWPPDEA